MKYIGTDEVTAIITKEEREQIYDAVDMFGMERLDITDGIIAVIYQTEEATESVGKEAADYLSQLFPNFRFINMTNKESNEFSNPLAKKLRVFFTCDGFGIRIKIIDTDNT